MAYSKIIAREGYYGNGLGSLFSVPTYSGPQTLTAPPPAPTTSSWNNLGQPPKTSGTVTFTGGSGSTTTQQSGESGFSKFMKGFFSAFTPQQQPGVPQQPMVIPPQQGSSIPWVPILLIGGVGLGAVVLLSRKKKTG